MSVFPAIEYSRRKIDEDTKVFITGWEGVGLKVISCSTRKVDFPSLGIKFLNLSRWKNVVREQNLGDYWIEKGLVGNFLVVIFFFWDVLFCDLLFYVKFAFLEKQDRVKCYEFIFFSLDVSWRFSRLIYDFIALTYSKRIWEHIFTTWSLKQMLLNYRNAK